MSYRKLTKEEVYELIAKAQQGDEEAMTKLYHSFERFIHKIVIKFSPGELHEEYFQIGCIGFLKAVKDFDFSLGYSFTTYMEPKVRGEITRHIRDYGKGRTITLKFSRRIKEIGINVLKLSNETGLSYEEVISSLMLDEEIEREVLAYLSPVGSLQKTMYSDHSGGEDITFEETIAFSNDDSDLWQTLYSLDIDNLLNEKEKKVFHLKFVEGLKQVEIARILNTSQAHVSRIEMRVKRKIAKYFDYDPNSTSVRARRRGAFKKKMAKEEVEMASAKLKQALYIRRTYPELKQVEIAKILGVSESTVSIYFRQIKNNNTIEPDPSIEPAVKDYIAKFYPERVSSPVKIMKIEDLPEDEREKYMVKNEQKQETFKAADKQSHPLSMLPTSEASKTKSINASTFTFAGNGEAVKTFSFIYLEQIMNLIKSDDEVEIKIDINVKPKVLLE